MEQFAGHFLNANELILSESFDIPHDWTFDSLNRIILCQQLTSLTVQYHHLSFEQLLELLHRMPNIHTLILHSVSINQHSQFQFVANMNMVTNLTVSEAMTLEEVQLLTTLFPRLNSLTTNFHQEGFEPIVRFLCSRSNENVRHLSSLCVLIGGHILIEKLHTLIESEQFLQGYSLKLIARKLYLWW